MMSARPTAVSAAATAMEKQDEYNARQRFGMGAIAPKRNEVQVGRVEHQFDADENQDRVATCQRPRQPNAEEQSREEQVSAQRIHSPSFWRIARITPPIKAAVRSMPTISKGKTYRLINSSPIWRTEVVEGGGTGRDFNAGLDTKTIARAAKTSVAIPTPAHKEPERMDWCGGSLPPVNRMAKTSSIAHRLRRRPGFGQSRRIGPRGLDKGPPTRRTWRPKPGRMDQIAQAQRQDGAGHGQQGQNEEAGAHSLVGIAVGAPGSGAGFKQRVAQEHVRPSTTSVAQRSQRPNPGGRNRPGQPSEC